MGLSAQMRVIRIDAPQVSVREYRWTEAAASGADLPEHYYWLSIYVDYWRNMGQVCTLQNLNILPNIHYSMLS